MDYGGVCESRAAAPTRLLSLLRRRFLLGRGDLLRSGGGLLLGLLGRRLNGVHVRELLAA